MMSRVGRCIKFQVCLSESSIRSRQGNVKVRVKVEDHGLLGYLLHCGSLCSPLEEHADFDTIFNHPQQFRGFDVCHNASQVENTECYNFHKIPSTWKFGSVKILKNISLQSRKKNFLDASSFLSVNFYESSSHS